MSMKFLYQSIMSVYPNDCRHAQSCMQTPQTGVTSGNVNCQSFHKFAQPMHNGGDVHYRWQLPSQDLSCCQHDI